MPCARAGARPRRGHPCQQLAAAVAAVIACAVGQFAGVPQRRQRLRELAQRAVEALAGRRSAAVFASPGEYDDAVRMLVDTGVILDKDMIYWDVRPSAEFPTVEVRVADVPATVDETVLLATLIRAAVMTALDSPDDARRLPPGALRAAYWKAAHDGLSGHTLDLIHGRGAVPAREQLGALVQRVRPALESLGNTGTSSTNSTASRRGATGRCGSFGRGASAARWRTSSPKPPRPR